MSVNERGASAALQTQALWRLAAAFATGASLNVAFAPFGWWPVAVVAPAALFALIRGLPPRRAGWTGAAFGAGLFALGTYWLYTCLHVFGLVPIWLTVVLQAALVGLMSLYSAALCYLANRFWLKPGATRAWLVLPVLWVLLEWLRGWALSGFPWLSLGYAMIDSPLRGWAPLFGVYGVTWAAATMAVALNVLLMPSVPVPRRLIALAGIVALFLIPALLARYDWTRAAGSPVSIAAVQGAVSQDQKWQAKNLDETMKRYSRLTAQAWGARLIVWPEAALPVLANEIPDYLRRLQEQGHAHDADIAVGLVNYEPATKRYYNGLLILSGSGGGWYYKRHLVPFGEYFPVPAFVRSWLRLMSLHSTAPHQHLQIARMRALEAGRYLVRAANDGITAAIGPHGEIVARLPQFQEAVLRADVQSMTGLTPYARLGNYPVVISAGLMLAVAVWRRRQGDAAR